MKLILAVSVMLLTTAAAAQHKLTFSSQNYAGLLEGEQGSTFQLQSINGMRYKGWFAGLGTGIDWYYRRSIPAFVSMNRDFLKKGKRNFFIATDAGINFPWRVDKNDFPGYTIEESDAGIYWAAGLGYRIGIGKLNDAVLVQLGYSYKHISEKAKPLYYYVNPYYTGPKPDMTNQFDYYLRRLSLKLGWNF